MNDQSLGRLQRVELRTIWTSEAEEFTPWLSGQENLKTLGETLGLELELEAVEKEVGSFRADIVCKEVGTDSKVLIENQLEKTDHDHLGKLLTYAAGLHAVTVVWVARKFRDEHRAALDWLNEITHEDSRFFGLEIELWRIGDSLVAPKFNVLSMPNDWSRSVAQAARKDDAELSELRLMQRNYWAGVLETLEAMGGPVGGNLTPQPRSSMGFGIGVGGFNLSATMYAWEEKWIRVDLYIKGESAERHLALLEGQKDEIKEELGHALEWGDQKQVAVRDRRIACYWRDVDPEDESDWRRQHEWLATHLNEMHRVFSRRIRKL